MTFRVAQISDTHLSREKPFFVENFTIVATALAASGPDLVLNTGDMSLDGIEKDVGYVEHCFEPDGSHSSVLVHVPGLKRLDIADFTDAAFGGNM